MAVMGVDSLKANLTNPARNYLWEVFIPSGVGASTYDLLVRCRSTSIPGRAFGEINIPFKQSGGIVIPGKLSYSHNWSCVFLEGEDKKAFTSLYTWNQAIIHDRFNIGVGDIVTKSDLYLSLLTTKGASYLRLRLVGCYPNGMGEVALSQAEDGIIQYPVTFRYDYWEQTL